jgi:hypothetical protein
VPFELEPELISASNNFIVCAQKLGLYVVLWSFTFQVFMDLGSNAMILQGLRFAQFKAWSL